MEKWLQQRLTPAKQKEARWIELAEVLEKLWVERFDPDISRLERLRSSYLADEKDLVKKIRQMGDYFSFELPKEADRPIALAWRRLEIEYKDMELILRSVFRRHFGDFPVAWYPIFAPNNKPYGEGFKVGDYLFEEWKKNVAPDGYFLTSRGVVGVDKLGLYREGLSKEAFRNEAHPLVIRTKPLHIVFDGFLWFIRHELGPFDSELNASWEANEFVELQFGPIGSRFDYLPADERPLDYNILPTKSEIERAIEFDFLGRSYLPWHLDMFLPQGFGDILPVDLLLKSYEGKTVPPFSEIFSEKGWKPDISDFARVEADILREEIHRSYQDIFVKNVLADLEREQKRVTPVIFQDERPVHLDMFYPLDFADWIPADLADRGIEGQMLKPMSLVYGENDWKPALEDFKRVEVAIQRYENKRSLADLTPEMEMRRAGITERPQYITFQDKRDCRLDMFYPDGFSDFIPVDLCVRGKENTQLGPMDLAYAEKANIRRVFYSLPPEPPLFENEQEKHILVEIPQLAVSNPHEQGREFETFAFCQDEMPLDRLPGFDGFSGDFAPLDYPYGGFV